MATGETLNRGGLMRGFIAFVLRRRWWVLAVVAGLTGLAGVSISRMHISNSLAGMLLGEHPEFDDYVETTKRFGSDPLLVFGIDDPEFLAPSGQERLRRLVGALEGVEGVAKVRSVLDAVQLKPGPLFPIPVRYVDEARAHPASAPALQRRLAGGHLAGGRRAGCGLDAWRGRRRRPRTQHHDGHDPGGDPDRGVLRHRPPLQRVPA